MFQQYGWLLVAGPVAVMAVLLLLRPKKQDAGNQRVAAVGPKPTLDLGGMALIEVLRRLDEAITKLEAVPQGDDSKELADAIVVMARSGLAAYTQSMEWRKSLQLPLDPLTSKSMSENLLDALKLLEIGSPHWRELKAEMDTFHSYVLSGQIWSQPVAEPTEPQRGPGAGGSTPPPPITPA